MGDKNIVMYGLNSPVFVRKRSRANDFKKAVEPLRLSDNETYSLRTPCGKEQCSMHENRLEMCVSKDATTCLMLDVVRGTQAFTISACKYK